MSFADSFVYGGDSSSGDATSDAGKDAIISVGSGNELWSIDRIVAKYSIDLVSADFDNPVTGSRSLTGRLLVTEGRQISRRFSDGATLANPFLFARYGDVVNVGGNNVKFGDGKVLYDTLIHDFHFPFVLDVPTELSFGALRGSTLNVILIAANHFKNGALVYGTIQQLHVHATQFDPRSAFKMGSLKSVD